MRSPNGRLPYLRTDGGQLVAGYARIAQHLRSVGLHIVADDADADANGRSNNRSADDDAEKPAAQSTTTTSVDSRSSAYLALLQRDLYAALHYELWGEPAQADTTRQLYARRTAFPLNFWSPQAYIRHTDRLMQVLENFSVSDKLIEHQTSDMQLRARKCLNQMEELLETNIGRPQRTTKSSSTSSSSKSKSSVPVSVLESPSELDAALYAYAAVILNVLPHNNALRAHAAECKRLVEFVRTFGQRHFGADCAAMAAAREQADRAEEQRLAGTATTLDMEEEAAQKTTLGRWMPRVLAGAIAVVAMSLFAYRQGIVARSMRQANGRGGAGGGAFEAGGAGDDDDDDDEQDDD